MTVKICDIKMGAVKTVPKVHTITQNEHCYELVMADHSVTRYPKEIYYLMVEG